jgi:hypothetical protein
MYIHAIPDRMKTLDVKAVLSQCTSLIEAEDLNLAAYLGRAKIE